MRQTLLYITFLLFIPINIYGQKDSSSKKASSLVIVSKENKQLPDTLYIKQIESIANKSENQFNLKVWLPTFTALIVLLITNLVTLYKIRKDTSESIKKDIITTKIKIERERLEKFYNPIFTTLKSDDYEVNTAVIDKAISNGFNLIVFDHWIFATSSGKDYSTMQGIPIYSVPDFIKAIKARDKLDNE